VNDSDRFRPMAELVEEAITTHRAAIAVVELHHVPSDGGPFTDVQLKDANGRLLASHDRSGFPTPDAHWLLDRYFEHVRTEDHGLNVKFVVSGLRKTPLPKR